MAAPQEANQRWSLDFISDALSDGRRFRILTVVDDHTREALATVVDTSLSGLRVVRELDHLVAQQRVPVMVVSDNGTELTSTAVLRWAQGNSAEDSSTSSAPDSPECRKPLKNKALLGCPQQGQACLLMGLPLEQCLEA